jgi:hypothetical protein
MIHDEVVKLHSLFFLEFPFKIETAHIFLELGVPFLLEFLPCEKGFPKYSHFKMEHVGESTFFESFLYLTHFPFEAFLFEFGDVTWDESFENYADFFEIFLKFLEVEFKRTEGDSAVVERGNSEILLIYQFRLFDIFEGRVVSHCKYYIKSNKINYKNTDSKRIVLK